jgi:hypothetical protein
MLHKKLLMNYVHLHIGFPFNQSLLRSKKQKKDRMKMNEDLIQKLDDSDLLSVALNEAEGPSWTFYWQAYHKDKHKYDLYAVLTREDIHEQLKMLEQPVWTQHDRERAFQLQWEPFAIALEESGLLQRDTQGDYTQSELEKAKLIVEEKKLDKEAGDPTGTFSHAVQMVIEYDPERYLACISLKFSEGEHPGTEKCVFGINWDGNRYEPRWQTEYNNQADPGIVVKDILRNLNKFGLVGNTMIHALGEDISSSLQASEKEDAPLERAQIDKILEAHAQYVNRTSEDDDSGAIADFSNQNLVSIHGRLHPPTDSVPAIGAGWIAPSLKEGVTGKVGPAAPGVKRESP